MMELLNERLEATADEMRSAAAGLPERSWAGPTRRRGAHLALAVVGIVAAAAFIVGPAVWLNWGAGSQGDGSGAGSMETSAPDLSTPTTVPTTATEPSEEETPSTAAPEPGGEWTSVGEPISDDEFTALFSLEPVPGTARRLAWTVGYDGQYTLGLFAVQVVGERGLEYDLWEYGLNAAGRHIGTGLGASAPERFAELASFGISGGGTCLEPIMNMVSVWGVPESVDSVVFELSDGTRLVGETVDGVVQVAWGSDVQVHAVTFEGATTDQVAKLRSFTDTVDAHPMTCAETG